MNILTSTVARILVAIPFLVFGAFHLMNAGAMSGMVPAFLPAPIIWVYITGISMIAGAIGLIAKIKTRLAALCLAVLVAAYVITLHIPGAAGGNQNSVMALLKDLGLIGGLLTVAGNFGD